ncbi:hypothetical protein ACTHAM_002624 [Cellulomonas soli]|uniref:hypothetical protein n=1 Tax=Cellulomonas soli TaxID=931535 RepID=UPI003F83DD6C
MPSPLPVDRARYLRLRWQARAATAVACLLVAPVLLEVLRAARSGDRAGALWLLNLALVVAGAGAVVAAMWKRSFAARPHVLPVDAGPGQAAGVPELDEPSGRHLGLGGDQEPPSRW